MAASDGKDYVTTISGDPSGYVAAVDKMVKATTTASATIDAQFKKVGDGIAAVNKYLGGFVAVLAGGGALKDLISSTNDWNGSAGKMAKQLGITTQQASVTNVALKHLGIESDVMTDASMKLSKQIQSNGQAFEVLGVKTRDSTGAYRPVVEIMGEVNAKLAAIKNPIEQNIAGLQVYGKGWTEIRGILRLTSQEMNAAETRARALGLIVGPEGVAMTKQYSEQMRDLSLVGKSLEVQIGSQLLPVFIKTGKFLGDEGPAMGRVFAAAIELVGFTVQTVWLALKGMGDTIGAIAAGTAALLQGDFAGAKTIFAAWDQESEKRKAQWSQMRAEFNKPLSIAPLPTQAAQSGGPQYHFKEKKEGGASEKESSRLPQWEATLAERKAVLERQGLIEGQFREMSKAEEQQYWDGLKGMQGLSNTERIAVSRKSAETELASIKQNFEVKVATLQAEAAAYKSNTDEKMRIELQIQSMYAAGTKEYAAASKALIEIQRQADEQSKAMRDARLQADRDAQLATLNLEMQTVQTAVALGTATKAQELAAQEAFEQRRNAIAADALQQRLQAALLDPDRNPVEVQKINLQIEALEAEHQLKLNQIRSQAQIESAKYQTQFFGGMQSSLQRTTESILLGTTKLRDGFRTAFNGMGQALAQTTAKMASDWVMAQIKMRLSSKETSLAQLNNSAVAAAGGAYQAIVGIPYVGPFLAPVAAAVAYAGVMAFGASASAEGGYDIPANVNPLVQTHAREMILPAKHADVIRAMADGDGGAAGGSGGDQFHFHGMDTQGVERLIRDNGRVLVDVLKKQRRNFAL